MTFDQLTQSSFPTNVVATNDLRLYHRGVEQAIEVVDGGDGQLNPGDYIEFLGTRNDGILDNDLYLTPEAQPHSYYNLFSDTTAYFLTWTPASPGKRMTLNTSPDPATPPLEFHEEEQLIILTSNYSPGRRYPIGGSGNTYNSQYDFGEGFTGGRIRNGGFIEYEFDLVDYPFLSGSDPKLEILLAGRNGVQHNAEISVGAGNNLRSLGQLQFQYFDNYLFTSDYILVRLYFWRTTKS